MRAGDASRDGDPKWLGLADFLAEQMFGRWDLVIHYDLARGLRCLAGSNGKRLAEMVTIANKWIGDLRALPRDPTKALAALDLLVQKNVMADPDDRVRTAILIDHAGYVAPSGDRLDLAEQTHLVTLLNWASSPYVKRLNMAFVLIDPRASARSPSGSRAIRTSRPSRCRCRIKPSAPRFCPRRSRRAGARPRRSRLRRRRERKQKLTAGVGLTDLEVLLRSALDGGRRLDTQYFRELKKRLIEQQAQGMLEFIEPKWSLATVVGHEGAKKRLLDDAELIKRGELDTVPMGYLFCGPVGTGKSFLATCVAGSMGVPVVLKNFRSEYVGETEGNLERVLGVLRSMGPVVVVVDEADAMLGDRDQGGDSGVGARTFGMIAAQMGDTRYRGKIVWMLLTARPDLLPIDLKRQGRAEVHIPLFYPTEDAELRTMFTTLAKKSGTSCSEADLPAEFPHKGNLSGADIEGIVGRAYRTSLLGGSRALTKDALATALAGFMPSTQTLEREAQELAAIIECTDVEFLPPVKQQKLAAMGGRERLQERMNAIKQILEKH